MSTKQRYALIDSNKKVNLENPLCPDESRILTDILKNHPLKFKISASSSVPWIYLGIALGRLSLLFKESNNTDSLSQIHKADRKSKCIIGMKIQDWMITNEMKFMENYWLYAEVFSVDVLMTQSQPIESTQGTHRTTSAPRLPNHVVAEGESKLEPTQNVEKVKEHLIATEIEKLVEGSENVEETVEVTSSPLRNDDNQNDPGTRLDPRSDKESPEVENISDISQPVNVIEEEEESAEDDYELRRREKGKHLEEIRNTPSPTIIRSPKIPTNLLQGHYGYLFEHLSAKFMPRRKFNVLAKNLEDIMMESLPKLVDEHIKKILQSQVPLHVA
ncbi:hypothetical protein Tco_0514461 [Tanacetum coccineum]